MKLLTAAQMQEVDRVTIQECGVPGPVLMEQAARAVTALLHRRYAQPLRRGAAILCGRGNNGGDGMVVARLLHEAGLPVRLVLLGDPATIRGDALVAWQAVEAMAGDSREGFELLVAATEDAWPPALEALLAGGVLVDALLGTGLSSPPRGLARRAILDLNRELARRHPAPAVVAVDMPSGLQSDAAEAEAAGQAGEESPAILRAECTVTFTAPKLGQFLSSGAACAGRLRVEAIGTPAAVMDRAEFNVQVTTGADCQPFLQPRPSDSHKGSFGHVLVLGGSLGKSGAIALAGTAALRIGAGLVTVATPRSVLPLVAAFRPELMTEPLDETPAGSISRAALDSGRIAELLATRSLLAVGPGITQAPETAELVRRVIASAAVPWVLDADGLNAFAGHLDQLRAGALGGVLTPHPGEMARLFGTSTKDVQARRRFYTERLAAETGAIVVLKGHRSLIAAPDGRLFVNTTGNPGMATGGTGDVLTGMIAGLLAQFPADRLAAVAAAVYLHGLAGDEGVLVRGEKGLLAGDLIEFLPRAIARASADRVEWPREWPPVRSA